MTADQTDQRDAPARLARRRERLLRLAVKWLWNRDDAEDVVQEAFVVAATRWPDCEDPRWMPRMIRTVCHLCRNHRRKRRPEPLAPWLDPPAGASSRATGGSLRVGSSPPAAPGSQPVARGSPPPQALLQAERLQRLRDAIERLPERQRTALVLRTMERMEYAAIAEVMELTPAAVRVHVHLARERLAALMDETEDD